jgi:hypothetical protein
MEVRYVDTLPKRGDAVMSVGGDVYLVSSVETDTVGGSVVTAVSERDFRREAEER